MEEKILKISHTHTGIFIERSNRFLSHVKIDGKTEKVHVHDPGRLKELLYEGNRVLLKKVDSSKRKTKWDLLAAFYKNTPVFVNSMYHSRIAREIITKNLIPLLGNYDNLRSEVKLNHSRIDFLIEKSNKKIWVEVKGCTLCENGVCENGVALFPDAPTKRGARHINSLLEVKDKLNEICLLILIFRSDAKIFSPNEKTDPLFSETFKKAVKNGLKVFPLLLEYDGMWIKFLREIPLKKI